MDDLLIQQLGDLPAFRALLRSVEARFYADLPLARPILDLGCGDGHFGGAALGSVEAGFDPWWDPLTEARDRAVYRVLSQANGAGMPYPDGRFATVVSNSVLEHIADLPPVLDEVGRVLQSGGHFYFCVPGPSFGRFSSLSRGFEGLGLHGMAKAYRRFFNRISRHYHCDGVDVWQRRLAVAGLELKGSWAYFSRRALTALEWGHYLGVPSLVAKKLTGRWILWRARANLWPTERLMRPLYDEPLSRPPTARDGSEEDAVEKGAYLFFWARKPSMVERTT